LSAAPDVAQQAQAYEADFSGFILSLPNDKGSREASAPQASRRFAGLAVVESVLPALRIRAATPGPMRAAVGGGGATGSEALLVFRGEAREIDRSSDL